MMAKTATIRNSRIVQR